MPDGYTLTRDAILKLRRDHQRLASLVLNDRREQPGKARERDPTPNVRFTNASGEAIPPWAVMRVTDVLGTVARPIVEVEKANTDYPASYVFNSGRTIPIAGGGRLQLGPILKAKTKPGITPGVTARLNPVNAQWYLDTDRTLPAIFTCYGMVDTDAPNAHALGLWDVGPQAREIKFVLKVGGLGAGEASKTVTLTTYRDGSDPLEGAVSRDITVYNELGFFGDEGVQGYAYHSPEEDKYYIYQMECPT